VSWGRSTRLRAIGIAVFAIGIDLAFATYRVETRRSDDPRTTTLRRSIDAAHERQMGLLYGTTGAAIMSFVRTLDEPSGHAGIIAAASALGAILCFRAAEAA
jgi:hypothetical protein